MIVKGSMNYTYSGRKKRSYAKTRKVKETKDLDRNTNNSRSRSTVDYPSATSHTRNGHVSTKVDEQYAQARRDVSSSYTIAPAYNKGAYQVISKDNTKDIGK